MDQISEMVSNQSAAPPAAYVGAHEVVLEGEGFAGDFTDDDPEYDVTFLGELEPEMPDEAEAEAPEEA